MREGYELYPTLDYKMRVEKLLRKSGLMVAEDGLEDQGGQLRGRSKLREAKVFQDYLGSDDLLKKSLRVSKEAITTCGIWHENRLKGSEKKSDLFLAEIPFRL